MKLRAERTEFADAVSWATRTSGDRLRMPALSGVLLEAADGRLICRATDLEVAAEVSVPVHVDQPGRVLLQGRLLAQLVARLPDAAVEIDGDSERATIKCGRATFRVRGMAVDDFPQLPRPDDAAPRGVVKADAFVRLVNQVARAASSDDARPVLTGVKLEAGDGALTAAATDSYRLAVRRLPWEEAVTAEALVPARVLLEAAKAAADAGGDVTVVLEPGQASFLMGDRRLTTRLVEGTFPNYRQLLPDGFETRVVVERAALVETLQRVAVVSLGETNAPVTLRFDEGTIELAASSQDGDEASEALPAEVDGESLTIAFNPSFLLTGLEAAGTEHVAIELRDGLKPAVVHPAGTGDASEAEDFTYLLMPVRTG